MWWWISGGTLVGVGTIIAVVWLGRKFIDYLMNEDTW